MNEEIKEILELFAFTDENIMFCDIVELNSKQSHLLLDYITNLQQENEKLKYNARGQVNDYFKDKYANEVLKNAQLQQEIERLNNIINELENILKLMINHGYCDTPNGDYKGTAVQGFMATGENSEFGVRAKFILDKLKKLKESGNNE